MGTSRWFGFEFPLLQDGSDLKLPDIRYLVIHNYGSSRTIMQRVFLLCLLRTCNRFKIHEEGALHVNPGPSPHHMILQKIMIATSLQTTSNMVILY